MKAERRRSMYASPARRSSRPVFTASTCRPSTNCLRREFLKGGTLTTEVQQEMAESLGADSLRYLPVSSIARAIKLPADDLCQACITGEYPTPCGQELYEISLQQHDLGVSRQRTYERVEAVRS